MFLRLPVVIVHGCLGDGVVGVHRRARQPLALVRVLAPLVQPVKCSFSVWIMTVATIPLLLKSLSQSKASYRPVDAGDGLLNNALAHAGERGELLEQDVGHVAAVVEHEIRLPRVAAAQTATKEKIFVQLGIT